MIYNPIFDQVWHTTLNAEGWVLLPHEHPGYSIQQAFSEVACHTRATDPDKLFNLAIEDYLCYENSVPAEIESAFRKWSKIQAENNEFMANDPYFQSLLDEDPYAG